MGGIQNGVSEMSSDGARDKLRQEDGGDLCERSGADGGDSPPTPPFESALRAALEADRIADARALVANAEAVLFAHDATSAPSSERMTAAQLAAAKARIAIATGDGVAARAILVRAIENDPKIPALRTLMTEVMMATGRATDVRPVLQHLGNRQAIERDPAREVTPTPPTLRDTSC